MSAPARPVAAVVVRPLFPEAFPGVGERGMQPGEQVSFGREGELRAVGGYISRRQGRIAAGAGFALISRPAAAKQLWVEPAGGPARLVPEGAFRLTAGGRTVVRLICGPAEPTAPGGLLLDPSGWPALEVLVRAVPASRERRPSAAAVTLEAGTDARAVSGYLTMVVLCAPLLAGEDGELPDDRQIAAELAGLGHRRAPATCANDLSRFSELLELRLAGRHVSRDRLARTAVAAGLVTAGDVAALLAGELP